MLAAVHRLPDRFSAAAGREGRARRDVQRAPCRQRVEAQQRAHIGIDHVTDIGEVAPRLEITDSDDRLLLAAFDRLDVVDGAGALDDVEVQQRKCRPVGVSERLAERMEEREEEKRKARQGVKGSTPSVSARSSR